ncbi:hypothetical protein ACFLRT_01045 [Acidobacteriota bacterium]
MFNGTFQLKTKSQRFPEPNYLLYILLIFLGIILVKAAWICDDAYITFRTVDNFVNGHGLTWNVAERVQVYTHPFWMFLVSFFYIFTHDVYYTVIILSLCLSLLSVYLVSRFLVENMFSLFLVFSIFIFSRAFVDFSTSGLENPLSYLLLVIFFLIFFKWPLNSRNLLLLYITSSLALFNRLDTILFFIFPLVYATYKVWKQEFISIGKIFKKFLIGFSPIIVWMIFALIYYGFFFPNTYYAKLNTGIAAWPTIYQGFLYLLDSISHDTITLLVTGFVILTAFKTKEWRKMTAAAGILVYILYIVRIGGDFMSGRFLALPVLVAAILLSQMKFKPTMALTLSILFIFIGLSVQKSPIFYKLTDTTSRKMPMGIIDERGYYFSTTGLLTRSRRQLLPNHKMVNFGKEKKQKGDKVCDDIHMIGFAGYFTGPGVHIIDHLALADPLLSRLHIKKNLKWRPGHFRRMIPRGYKESLETGENLIKDPGIKALYEAIKEITRGKIFSFRRLKLIIKFNLGGYNQLMQMINQRGYK